MLTLAPTTPFRPPVSSQVRSDQPCWVERFNTSSTNTGSAWEMELSRFFEQKHDKTLEEIGGASSRTNNAWDFSTDIGTEKTGYSGNVRFMQVRMRVDMKTTEDPQKIKVLSDGWVAFVEKLNEDSKTKRAKVGNALLVSATFTSTDTTLRIVSSTLSSWVMSNLICLVSVLLFTQNIMISLYTMLAIVLIVATLLGVIFGIAQYPFGAIEAVGVTIFVGLSVDYCLHTAHGYSGSKSASRKN